MRIGINFVRLSQAIDEVIGEDGERAPGGRAGQFAVSAGTGAARGLCSSPSMIA